MDDKTMVAYAWIARRILTSTYRAGHRLVIDDLAGYLEMGNVPIREALRMLAAEGWVEWVPRVGARVAGGETGDASIAIQEQLAIVEGAAISMAAPRLDPSALDALERSADRLVRALRVDDESEATHARRDFHVLVLDPCPNPIIRRAASRHAMTFVGSCRVRGDRGRNDGIEHLEIVRRIRLGPGRRDIELLARGHRSPRLPVDEVDPSRARLP